MAALTIALLGMSAYWLTRHTRVLTVYEAIPSSQTEVETDPLLLEGVEGAAVEAKDGVGSRVPRVMIIRLGLLGAITALLFGLAYSLTVIVTRGTVAVLRRGADLKTADRTTLKSAERSLALVLSIGVSRSHTS